MIGDIKFVHPKNMQDGTILVGDADIATNPPYIKGVHLAFDHHEGETIRLDEIPENYIIDPKMPSAARVVYEHYGGRERFDNISDVLMEVVDKSVSGQFNKTEILKREDCVLLNYLTDSRNGLRSFKDCSHLELQLVAQLIECCPDHTVDQILALSDVKERVDM